MRKSLTAYLFLVLGLIQPVTLLFPALPEDLEGSGYDLDSSGSGDWSEGEMKNSEDQPNSIGTKNTFHGSSVLNLEGIHGEGGSGFIVVAKSKSFLENKDIFAAITAGGVTGVVLAVVLAALLIYTWQKKDNAGYILGQQRTSDGGYYRPSRGEVVV